MVFKETGDEKNIWFIIIKTMKRSNKKVKTKRSFLINWNDNKIIGKNEKIYILFQGLTRIIRD